MPARIPPSDDDGEEQLRIPREVAGLLDDAIKKSIDQALHAAGVKIPSPQEEAIVRRVSREVNVAFEQTISASYRGPIPPPEMLGHFDKVVPGLAGVIVKMATDEQRHRHRWESRSLWNDIFMQSGALTLGWVLAGLCVIAAFILATMDRTIGAGILLGIPALHMVRIIATGAWGKDEAPIQVKSPKQPAKKRR